jgi:hypothetical protein
VSGRDDAPQRSKNDDPFAGGQYRGTFASGPGFLEPSAMIQITPQMRILLAVEPIDFRCGIDGLVQVCRQQLQVDPLNGALFVLTSKRGKSIKVLCYDGQGFWLAQKRLSSGRFSWWPSTGEQKTCRLDAHQMQLLLWNGNPDNTTAAPLWRPLVPAG